MFHIIGAEYRHSSNIAIHRLAKKGIRERDAISTLADAPRMIAIMMFWQ